MISSKHISLKYILKQLKLIAGILFGLGACTTSSTPTMRQAADQCGVNLGVAIHDRFFDTDSLNRYKKVICDNFNMIVAENAMKPDRIQPQKGTFYFQEVNELIRFAENHQLKLRGHCLVWHKQIPEWMSKDNYSKEELLSVLKTHIITTVRHCKGKIYAWDVVNEAIDEHQPDYMRPSVWMKTIGPSYIDSAFVWAHQADPEALLFYNDYDAEGINEKSDMVYELVKGMKDRGIPIDGVGLQCHFELGKIDFESIRNNMLRLHELGLQTQITELDISLDSSAVNVQSRQKQGDAYGHLCRLCLSDNQCTALVIWGVSDADSWIPQLSDYKRDKALLFDENFNKKPAFDTLYSTIKNAI